MNWGPAGPAADEVVIGHPVCLSGRYAKAGEQAQAGVQACVEWVNRVHGGIRVGEARLPLRYRHYDCESRKEAVTSLLERLVTVDRVHAVLAPYSSGLTLAGAPVAEKYGIVYLDHGGASDKIFTQGFRYVVQTIGPGSKYHLGTLEMLSKRDPAARRLALAYEDSEFARMVRSGAAERARALGYEIVFDETYPQGVSDLTPLLSAMKAARPDVFLGGGHFEDGQLLNRQMADLDLNVSAMSLIAAATLPAFHDALTSMAEGVMGPSHWEYGVSYSAAAAEEAGSTDSDAVRRALGELRFMSFYGIWDVDETGMQVGHSMVDVQWQEGRREIVWPPAARTAELVYPKPDFPK